MNCLGQRPCLKGFHGYKMSNRHWGIKYMIIIKVIKYRHAMLYLYPLVKV